MLCTVAPVFNDLQGSHAVFCVNWYTLCDPSRLLLDILRGRNSEFGEPCAKQSNIIEINANASSCSPETEILFVDYFNNLVLRPAMEFPARKKANVIRYGRSASMQCKQWKFFLSVNSLRLFTSDSPSASVNEL